MELKNLKFNKIKIENKNEVFGIFSWGVALEFLIRDFLLDS